MKKVIALVLLSLFVGTTVSFGSNYKDKAIEYAEKGKFIKSIEILEKYVANHPEDKEAKDLLVSLYLSRLSVEDLSNIKDKEKRRFLEKLKDSLDDFEDPYIWVFRGKFLESENLKEALNSYKRAVKFDPENSFALYKIGKLSEKAGNPLNVRTVYSSIVEKQIMKGFPESLVYLPANSYVLVVDKSLQTLFVYKTDMNGRLSLFRYMPSTTGQNFGKKSISGDKKTPTGIYFFTRFKTRRDLGNSPLYGSGAFVTDYPNLIDRLLKKNGYGIWLHGSDIKNRAKKPFQTQGCVVVENQYITDFRNIIKLNQTPIVIEDKVNFVRDNSKIRKTALNLLYKWKTSWENKDVNTFFSLYHKDYRYGKNLRGNLKSFIKSKRYRILKKKSITVDIGDLKILYLRNGYKDQDLLVMHFLQYYKGDYYQDFGIKKIYWVGKGNNFKIIGEEFKKLNLPRRKPKVLLVSSPKQTKYSEIAKLEEKKKFNRPKITKQIKTETPKLKKSNYIPKKTKPVIKKIKHYISKRKYPTPWRLIKAWERYWETKNVDGFVSLYCDDFKWRKGGKKEWKDYKRKTILNKRFIKLDIKLLKTKDLPKQKYLVILKQKYQSDKFKSTINKKLILKYENNSYCIYRETSL